MTDRWAPRPTDDARRRAGRAAGSRPRRRLHRPRRRAAADAGLAASRAWARATPWPSAACCSSAWPSASAIFFLLPLFLAQATVGRVDQGFGLQLSEGLIRVAIFIGYLLLVGRAADVRRTFQYHGAEHMSIHALEAGDPLTVEAARKYPTAHPRCGTEFLVVVLIVSILAFAFVRQAAAALADRLARRS